MLSTLGSGTICKASNNVSAIRVLVDLCDRPLVGLRNAKRDVEKVQCTLRAMHVFAQLIWLHLCLPAGGSVCLLVTVREHGCRAADGLLVS